MGFASGFRAGSDVMRQAIDSYNAAKQRKQLGAIMEAKPEDFQGYTAQDGAQLEALANAKDANGNPYYTLQANQDGSYGVQSNFQVQGADGQMATPDIVGIQQRPVTQFLGQRFNAGELTPERMNTMRYSAAADVVGQTDPVAGLRMRRELAQDERDTARWDRETKAYNDAEALKTGRQAYFKELSQLTPDELAEKLGGSFSSDGSGVDAMLTFDPKANKFMFASRIPGMPSRTLDRAELLNYAMGVWEQGNGDFSRGMEMQLNTLREKRRMDEADRTEATNIARGNADLHWKDKNFSLEEWYKRGALANDAARTGIAAQGLKLREREMDQANWQPIGASADGKGLMRYNRVTGQIVNQPMPEGTDARSVWSKISGQKPDISVEKLYEQLVGSQIPGQPKGAVYSPEQAIQEARRLAAGQQDPFMAKLDALLGGGGSDPFAAPAPKAAPAQGLRQPTPEGQQLLRAGEALGISQPPAPPNTSQERLRQLYWAR